MLPVTRIKPTWLDTLLNVSCVLFLLYPVTKHKVLLKNLGCFDDFVCALTRLGLGCLQLLLSKSIPCSTSFTSLKGYILCLLFSRHSGDTLLEVHYMTKSMWTPARRTSCSKIMGINMELVPPFAALTASTLHGSLSIRCWNIAAGTCFHST